MDVLPALFLCYKRILFLWCVWLTHDVTHLHFFSGSTFRTPFIGTAAQGQIRFRTSRHIFWYKTDVHIIYGLKINMAHEILKFGDHILHNITHFQRKFTDFKYNMKHLCFLLTFLFMLLQVTFLSIWFVTTPTRKWFLFGMNSFMLCQVALLCKLL